MPKKRDEMDVLRAHLADLAQTKSLRRIATEDYGGRITHAVIHRIIHYGSEPIDRQIREALSLPELIIRKQTVHRKKGRFAAAQEER